MTLRRLPHIPLLVYSLTTAFLCLLLILDGLKPAHPDTFTVNATEGNGVKGVLLASPPGSCTAVPNGLGGDCSTRAAAALDAWLQGNYSAGKNWSDLREAAVTPLEKALRPPEPSTNIGTSWIPEICDQPSCGHLLKGDVILIDENLDGKIDDTWIDGNGNGIRETGEVDRLRAEQFAWGATSLIVDFNNLGSPAAPQILPKSGTSPPGLARGRVRVSLGDNPECVEVSSSDCHLSTGGAGVISLPFSVPDGTSNPNDASSTIDNNNFFGVCDPDRFTGSLISIQRQLDNCLWKVGSTPVTAIQNASVTGQENAVRGTWIDQRLVKYTASITPDRQNFVQNWFAEYGFDHSMPIDKAIYHNELILHQTDIDPNPTLNYKIDPTSGLLVVDGKFHDTYNSAFRLAHTAHVRAYGFDFSGNAVAAEPGDTPLDTARIGKTNPTDDPFWGAENGPLGFDTDFNTNAKSGVGQATGFRFLYQQEVEGDFVVCVNCGHEPITVPNLPSYFFIFPTSPSTLPDNHPPDVSGSVSLVGP